jgi:glutathione S-transferase
MTAKLYWFAASHPAMAARKMLELKGVDFETVEVMPGTQRVHLRLARFRGGTVPALKLDGHRVQGSRRIARALDQLRPEPPLFPLEPELRAPVEAAERWGEEVLQSVPRVLLRSGLVRHAFLRRWLAEDSHLPAPALVAWASAPTARYYAHAIGADDQAARRALQILGGQLDHVDALLADGTLATDVPNAATLQILASVRALDAFKDLHAHLGIRPATSAAQRLFPDYPGPIPAFLPDDWTAALGPG